jgi:hypothetical protein
MMAYLKSTSGYPGGVGYSGSEHTIPALEANWGSIVLLVLVLGIILYWLWSRR